ncbi:unnamed protein product [Penicillium roqueforti FM164]|uniref:Uncharacterized protein n=1 Tax=Penicillium roqueforti (strain FM164) TaxID=1365484 RepID=W6R3Z3_PENRF|nr:unnamed protein product [Penicillium roqueforti FM164]
MVQKSSNGPFKIQLYIQAQPPLLE